MYMLTNRMLSLMENIIENDSGIKVNDFATLYAVSSRVIYYDLEELSYYVKQERLPFSVCVQGGVVSCVCEEGGGLALWKEHIKVCLEKITYTPEERLLDILYRLLHGNVIRISSLMQELDVSKSTVVNDMDSIKQFFGEYHVKVSAAARNGFRFEGKREDICIASYHYLLSLLRCNNVLGRMHTESDIWRRKPYSSYIGEEEFRQAEKAVMAALEKGDLSYRMLDDCICAVLVMTAWNMPEEKTLFSEEQELLKNTEILHTAELIAADIQNLQRHIRKEDFSCFLALCMLRPGTDYHFALSLNQSIDLRVLAANFANEVCACLNVSVGSRLLHDIKNELFCLLTQPDMLLQIWDEKIIQTMKQEYEGLYKIVRKSSGMISTAFGHELSDRQIVHLMLSFVELYEQQVSEKRNMDILLVCNSGSVVSRLLSNQLQVFFDIHIAATVSVYELNTAIKKYRPEYIISTVPILSGKIRCVYVRHFLSRNDISKLSAFFALRRTNFQQENLPFLLPDMEEYEGQTGKSLSSIVLPECICLDAEYRSISGAVRAGGQLLKEQGFIDEAYIEEVEKAVRENGRFMLIGSGIIMPHSMAGYHVHRTGISIIRLKKPVRLYDVDIEVNWIFTLCALDKTGHLKALTQLTGIIGDSEKMQEMENSDSAEKLHLILAK